MGGIEPAYTFVKRCLEAGKSVVTSNKALVAKHGAELLSIARDRELNFLFEASVGRRHPDHPRTEFLPDSRQDRRNHRAF